LKELSNLKLKINELIEDNNAYIHELEKWLKQKSELMMEMRK
jgi:hypothetical protein